MAQHVFNPAPQRYYEDTYRGYLEFFKGIAEDEGCPEVFDIPRVYAPFCYYLGASIEHIGKHKQFRAIDKLLPFDQLKWCRKAERKGLLRELVESVSAFRPELVDALYLLDTGKWNVAYAGANIRHDTKNEIVVTNNGSFHRPEVLEQIEPFSVSEFHPRIVIVPCAADKPYPAPLHREVMRVLPPAGEWSVVIATGVLGLVPASRWDTMLHYDSGLPNQWRLMSYVREHIAKWWDSYQRIVVYSDFYNDAIETGIRMGLYDVKPHPTADELEWFFEKVVTFVNPKTEEYLPLMSEEYLSKLKEAVTR